MKKETWMTEWERSDEREGEKNEEEEEEGDIKWKKKRNISSFR
jgi:hypothetical protein